VSDDPRELLDEAARRRLSCQVMPRAGAWSAAQLVRVDRAGVVLTAPGLRLSGGEDLRVWFKLDEQVYSFEGSVLRAGVPVPERTNDGVLLGFIEDFRRERAEHTTGEATLRAVILPPQGRGLELVGGVARLVEVGLEGLSFSVPQSEPLKFVEGGRVRVLVAAPDEPEHHADARVERLAVDGQLVLYRLVFEGVRGDDASAHLRAIEALRVLA